MVDDEDFRELSKYTWDLGRTGYVRARPCVEGVRHHFLLHRIILGAKKCELVDHINGDKLDNRRCNIRLATHEENSRNRKTPITNRSGYKGVAKVKGYEKYKAYVQLGKGQSHLGYFDNPHDAARMYNFWALDLFGEFARLNIIEEETA